MRRRDFVKGFGLTAAGLYAPRVLAGFATPQTIARRHAIVANGNSLPVTDDMNRANSAVSLGSMSDGIHSWTAEYGTWGISSNKAYSPTIGPGNFLSVASVETGAADCTLTLVLSNMLSVAQETGIMFRMQDNEHYFLAAYNWGQDKVLVYRYTGGGFNNTPANAALPAPPAADNTTLKVVLLGTSVKVYHENVEKISVTLAEYVTATKHGMYIGNTSTRVDDFSIVA